MSKKKYLGHTARKRFGQNFLCDDNIISSIVATIYPKPNQTIVEIGPGLGALTEHVADMVDKLHVIELDRDLADRLRHHPFLNSKLIVHEADAQKFDFRSLQKNDELIRVFGNLPYNISTPLIFHLLNYIDLISDMHFMLQKEVVERMSAEPNTKQYGRLSVITQYFCKVSYVLDVPPASFNPPPKVDSAIVKLEPYSKDEMPYTVSNINTLQTICKEAFNQRRKTIRNSLSNLLTEEELINLDINIKSRAENITIAEFCKMANYIASKESN